MSPAWKRPRSSGPHYGLCELRRTERSTLAERTTRFAGLEMMPEMAPEQIALVIGHMELYYVRLAACVSSSWKAASHLVEHSAQWQIGRPLYELQLIQPRPPKLHMVRWFEAHLSGWQPSSPDITDEQWEKVDKFSLEAVHALEVMFLHLAFSDVPPIREALANARGQIELWTDTYNAVPYEDQLHDDESKESVSWRIQPGQNRFGGSEQLADLREAAIGRATWHSAVTPELPTMPALTRFRVARCSLERNPDAIWRIEANHEWFYDSDGKEQRREHDERHSDEGATVVLCGDPIGHVPVRDVHALKWERVLGDALLIHRPAFPEYSATDELHVLRCAFAWCGKFPWTDWT